MVTLEEDFAFRDFQQAMHPGSYVNVFLELQEGQDFDDVIDVVFVEKVTKGHAMFVMFVGFTSLSVDLLCLATLVELYIHC